jgi:hypothetical protein
MTVTDGTEEYRKGYEAAVEKAMGILTQMHGFECFDGPWGSGEPTLWCQMLNDIGDEILAMGIDEGVTA